MTEPTTPQLTEDAVREIEARRRRAMASWHSGGSCDQLLEIDIPALIRDWRALRQWKAEALPLLTRYDNLAETFGGTLGSLKVANLERGVAALREQLATARKQIALWFGPNTCSVCGGAPLASGRPCICGGKGTMQAEFEGLRQELFDTDSQLAQVTNERDAALDTLHGMAEATATANRKRIL